VDVILPDRIAVTVPSSVDLDSIRQLVVTPGRVSFIGLGDYEGEVFDGEPLPDDSAASQVLLFGNEGIASARPGTDSLGEPALDVELTTVAAAGLDAYAAEHLGHRVAIVLDGLVVSAPVLQTDRFGGELQIPGDFTVDDVRGLVTSLKLGALPVALQELGVSSVACG
jgi:preprotein translocase subunit SecD